MDVISRIKRTLGFTPTAVRHNHRYVDTITGERFDVVSVGRWVEIERLDAERRPENIVRKDVVIRAIDGGFVEHDPDRCPACTENTDV